MGRSRAPHRRRELLPPETAPLEPEVAPSPPQKTENPVLALQRKIGNRAVGQMIARTPTRTGTVKIAGVGTIKVKGGNLDEWAGTETLDTVEVTSEKGKHSKKLEKLFKDRTTTSFTVMIGPEHKEGEDLNVAGGTELTIKEARVVRYAEADGVETWVIGRFEKVARKKITHRIGSE
jgi:hypothetical protein